MTTTNKKGGKGGGHGQAPRGWKKLLVWKFQGSRFADHGVDLRDLDDLVTLRKLLAELAKDAWRQAYPDKSKLPNKYEDQLELRFFKIGKGSAAVPIYYHDVPKMDLPLPGIVPPPDSSDVRGRLPEAALTLVRTIQACAAGKALPERFPRTLALDLQRLASDLKSEESVSVQLPAFPGLSQKPATARLTDAVHAKISHVVKALPALELPVPVDIFGEVTAVNLRGRAVVACGGEEIDVVFTPEQEKWVTLALHTHASRYLRIIGYGRLNPFKGTICEVTKIENLILSERPMLQRELRLGVDGSASDQDTAKPSVALFERLAAREPAKLVALIEAGTLRPSDLTFAAEIVGRIPQPELIVPVLTRLLDHSSPLIREGAVYGLSNHMSDTVRATLRRVVEGDASPGVREAAQSVLED